MNDPTLSPHHPVNLIPTELMSLGSSKFEAKLSSTERCQILALRLSGMSIGAIAVTFGVNRRTVTHIHNESSPRYHSVRKIAETMGRDAFLAKFVTEDLIDRIRANAVRAEAQESGEKADKRRSTESNGVPNPRATRHAGITMHKGPGHEFTHRIEVLWVEGKEGYADGWYSKLLDSGTVDATEPFGDPDAKTHMTSATALAYAREYANANY